MTSAPTAGRHRSNSRVDDGWRSTVRVDETKRCCGSAAERFNNNRIGLPTLIDNAPIGIVIGVLVKGPSSLS